MRVFESIFKIMCNVLLRSLIEFVEKLVVLIGDLKVSIHLEANQGTIVASHFLNYFSNALINSFIFKYIKQ